MIRTREVFAVLLFLSALFGMLVMLVRGILEKNDTLLYFGLFIILLIFSVWLGSVKNTKS